MSSSSTNNQPNQQYSAYSGDSNQREFYIRYPNNQDGPQPPLSMQPPPYYHQQYYVADSVQPNIVDHKERSGIIGGGLDGGQAGASLGSDTGAAVGSLVGTVIGAPIGFVLGGIGSGFRKIGNFIDPKK